jgi:hypothetical protein
VRADKKEMDMDWFSKTDASKRREAAAERAPEQSKGQDGKPTVTVNEARENANWPGGSVGGRRHADGTPKASPKGWGNPGREDETA